MARTPITAELPTGAYPVAMSVMVFQAGDEANGNSVLFSGKRLVLYAHNTDDENQTLFITTVADALGRKDDQTLTITPDTIIRIDGLATGGFVQADGSMWIDVSSSAVELCVYFLDR